MEFSSLINNTKRACRVSFIYLSLCVLLAPLQASADSQESYAANQNRLLSTAEITVSFENISLDEALLEIGNLSGYSINYAANLFDSKQTVSAKADNISLSSLLKMILPQGIHFEQMNGSIVLTKRQDIDDVLFDPIKGIVVDATSGIPLVGVNILVKGTTSGTITDANGTFELLLSELNKPIIISMIGYESLELEISSYDDLFIELEPLAVSSDELVVLGYGAVDREDVTGSISSIQGVKFENIPSARLDQMLQGRIAGVQVTQASGAPGTASTIRVRGGNSIQGDNSPLFVIDDFIVGTGFNLNNINPNDINSIEVLKDATAVAVYGTRGANGVILITTKDGSNINTEYPEITINSYSGAQYMMNNVDLLTGPEQAAYANEDAAFRNTVLPFSDISEVDDVNWINAISRDGRITNSDISVAGQSSSQNLNYYISGNYFDQEGIIKSSGIQRYSLRTNVDLDLSEKFKSGIRLNLSTIKNQNLKTSFSNLLSRSGLTSRSIYNELGEYTYENPVSASLSRNALADVNLRSDHTNSFNLLGNLYLEYSPFSNLTLRTSFGSTVRYSKRNIYNPGILPERLIVNEGGSANVSMFTQLQLLNENTVFYSNSFSGGHDINFLAGFTWQTSESESVDATGFNFPNDALEFNNLSNGSDPLRNQIGSGWDSFQLVSWLARANYKYRDKYLVTFVGRVDGSSRFSGTNNQYAFFPSAAIAWQLGEEPFIKEIDFIDELKLRASFGYSGSQAISSFRTLPTFNGTSAFFNEVEQYAVQNGRPASENLKWETTDQLDVGFELSMFNNSVSIVADYYVKNTNDLLLNVQIPRQTGFSSKLKNLGSIQNKGMELSINTRNVSNQQFLWTSTLKVSANRNKVTDLGGVDFIDLVSPTSGGPGGRLIVGQSAPVFVGVEYLGTWKSQDEIDASGQQAQQVGGPKFRDTNQDGDVSVDDFVVLGSPEPDFYGGIQNTFLYKNWELDVYIQGSYGNEIYNSLTQSAFFGRPESNKYKETVNRWTPDNSNSNIPRAGTVATLASVYSNSEMVEDGSHIRLKNLKLAYNVPTNKLKIDSIRDLQVYFMGTNLALLSNFRLFDPEVNQYSGSNVALGFSRGEYPYARVLTIGIKATL